VARIALFSCRSGVGGCSASAAAAVGLVGRRSLILQEDGDAEIDSEMGCGVSCKAVASLMDTEGGKLWLNGIEATMETGEITMVKRQRKIRAVVGRLVEDRSIREELITEEHRLDLCAGRAAADNS